MFLLFSGCDQGAGRCQQSKAFGSALRPLIWTMLGRGWG
jgi:hypothetical protein